MRLIDAEEVYKTLTEYYHHRTDMQHTALKEALDRVPTIEAEPVKHGKWIKQKNEDTDDTTIYGWECSVCSEGVVWRTDDDIDIEKFCYNCGAKMDFEEVNDETN